MTTAQQGAIPAPDASLLVYNVDTNLYEYFNGSVWGAVGGAQYWSRNAAGYLYPTTTTDTVRVDQGSVTNPSYGFLNTAAALLTGMYYAAANTIGFTSNGTQVGTFSTSSILFLGVTGAASTAGSSFGVATGTGGAGGADGGAFTAQTGTGSANAASAGGAGGAFTFTAGDGAAQSVAFTGGTGGTITAITGLGGANTGGASGSHGGAGGALQLSTGTGGATNSTNANKTGGAGGAIAITTGTGGAATGASVAANGGAGGNFTGTLGAGGAASGLTSTGSGGAGGTFNVNAGNGGSSVGGTGGTGGTAQLRAGAGGSSTSGSGGSGGTLSLQSQNGGSSTSGAGGQSGAITIAVGSGGTTAAAAANAGAGAVINIYPGAGGSNTGTGSGAGGTSNGVIVHAANGGSCLNVASTGSGGLGSPFRVTCGTGGATTGGSPGQGGDITLTTGPGGANSGGATGKTGGAAGGFTITGGAGGTTNSSAGGDRTGGAGCTVAITTGNGGSATAGGVASIGGAAGEFTVTGGTGGATSGTGAGGIGGGVNLNPGNGGTSVGGTAGAQGRVKIAGSGIFAYANAQSITPSATHTLILTATAGANQSVVASTFIKIASDAAGRQIVLPSEASSNGLMLVFANTSGANTMVLRNSTNTTTIATVAVSSQQAVMCDGTTWYPIAANSTPVSNYWQRTGTVLTPATAGDDVSSPRAAAGSFNEVFGSGAAITGTASGITMLGYGAGFSGSFIGNSVVIGTSAVVSSTGAYEITAIGRSVNISGAGNIGATVVGYAPQMTTANCYYATGIGHGLTLSSPYVTVAGSASAVATGDYSVLLGYATSSNGLSVIALGAGAQCSTANRCVIGGGSVGGTSGNITSIIVGNGETAATPVSFSMMPTQASGSDKNGSDFTVRGGRNTGAGAGGQFLIDIYPAGASSSTGGTATNMQRVVSTYYNERRAGSGSGFANIAGGLFAAYTDSASSGTSAQNLHSFTLIGNTLLHDGDSLVFDTAMQLDTLGGNLTIQCRLGTTDLTLFNAAAPAGATQANYRVTITRTGAATQRVKGELIIQATTNVTAAVYSTMAETLSGNLTLANRVTATVSGTITNQMSTVLYQPIPQT